MSAVIWAGVIIVFSAFSAIAFPFTTYATTLATFGIAHVAIELRYVDSRFHQQLDRAIEVRLVQLLAAIALLRCCAIWGWMGSWLAYILELCCGMGLVLFATRHLYRQNWRLGAIGIAVSCLLGIGIIIDPIATSITFAIIHNFTPVGFILERERSNFKSILLTCGFVFVVIPLLIILYQLFPILTLPLETNRNYLSAFIAPSWQKLAIAYPLFSAVTFLQCMHYATVIGLFSQWTKERSPTLLPWLPSKYFYCLLGGISLIFLVAFQQSFTLTRSFYGIAASIHAWLEIPLLLLLTQQLIPQKPAAIGSKISSKG
ncbi:MAG: hypothetical protein KME17_18765 [Cyanosarcina radialis HA8281-LM2]|jgi:hypothetical protein|nr:hypothetical protein [Cyanosarcina radialis HA8281-LM2]